MGMVMGIRRSSIVAQSVSANQDATYSMGANRSLARCPCIRLVWLLAHSEERGGLAPASRSLHDSGWWGGRVAFWESGLSNRPKRPHLRPVVDVRIIASEPLNSCGTRFGAQFCKTRQVCNANRKSDSKDAISDGTARQETL